MKREKFLWDLWSPLSYSPVGYVCAVIWNLSEITGLSLPKPNWFFEKIMGLKCSKKINK